LGMIIHRTIRRRRKGGTVRATERRREGTRVPSKSLGKRGSLPKSRGEEKNVRERNKNGGTTGFPEHNDEEERGGPNNVKR